MTEFELQLIIIHDARQLSNNLVVPNIEGGFGEMDVLKVSRAGYTTEYEIKISRADFKKDREKFHKHDAYQAVFEKCSQPKKGIPNYFVYVMPENLNLLSIDVPDYAGLYIVNNGYLSLVKPPPRIHKQKFREFWVEKIAKSLNAKYLYHYLYPLERKQKGLLE